MDAPHERRRQAVALAYKEDETAPRVVAKGYGELAERIMAEAQRQGIYVHDAPELVALLMQLNLDTEIPASLYQVVAELLVWVFELSSDESTHLARRK
ncbi:EscU/YscU/HrcU family type III secretion system export apparatus switch protein [Vreelandella malpeensis]|uniref:Flagellar biosynthetic protein FlhB n=1 Tax=Vreelandella malpeensis TaxID=1172368 RepID=A0ABS8DQG5_9GAMM|nr:EscU/YscU/HrcU family type III secretion system export apparatus switch protein [Halomonas malpeensis]MCB8888501.1 EscU/YscU/HrcU family type III secretion system export apparatus switch protein [Halomonas malpeensis]